MPADVNNNPDKVIDQLMLSQGMKESVQLQRTGAFQSRTVTVGDEHCSLQELISTIGDRIKNADVTKDEPDLEKLKEMLTAVSEVEKENRSGTASLFHFFSSRDKDVTKLGRTVDTKIKQHDAYMALEGGLGVELKAVTPFTSRLRALYAQGKEIKDDIRESRPFYVDMNDDNKPFSWVDNGGTKIQFYMQPDDIFGNPKYKVVLTDPNIGLTTEDVVAQLNKMQS